jgi:hypothetical protein
MMRKKKCHDGESKRCGSDAPVRFKNQNHNENDEQVKHQSEPTRWRESSAEEEASSRKALEYADFANGT